MIERLEEARDLGRLAPLWPQLHDGDDLVVDEIRWRLDFSPRWSLVFALRDESPVGYALMPILPWHGEDYLAADFGVLAESRRTGIGSALLARVTSFASTLGAPGIQLEVAEDDIDSTHWLERRGYQVVERQKAVALDLRSAARARPEPLPGVVLTSLRSRPDLVRSTYEAAIAGAADIPGQDSEREPPSFERWQEWELGRPTRRADLQVVAVDRGDVIGYATLDVFGRKGYHGLTVVRRAWRRRGVARALKQFLIARAIDAGLEQLVTESEESNQPMRRLNESLGYRPIPGVVVMRARVAR